MFFSKRLGWGQNKSCGFQSEPQICSSSFSTSAHHPLASMRYRAPRRKEPIATNHWPLCKGMGQNSMPQNVWVKNTHPRTAIHSTYNLIYGCVSNWGTTQKLKAKSQTCFQPWDLKWWCWDLLGSHNHLPVMPEPRQCSAKWLATLLALDFNAPKTRKAIGGDLFLGTGLRSLRQIHWSVLLEWIPSENMEKMWIHSDIQSPCNLHESVWLVWVTHTWTLDALIVSHVLCTSQYLTITSHLQSHS